MAKKGKTFFLFVPKCHFCCSHWAQIAAAAADRVMHVDFIIHENKERRKKYMQQVYSSLEKAAAKGDSRCVVSNITL